MTTKNTFKSWWGLRILTICATAILFSGIQGAHARPPMIEVGAGAVSSETGVDFLFRLKSDVVLGEHFILVRTDATGAFNGAGTTFVDLEVQGLGFEREVAPNVMAGFTFANFSFQRDLAIGLNQKASFELVGFRTRSHTYINENVKLVAELALQGAGLGIVERVNDQLRLDGISWGGKIQLGADFMGRFKVRLGAKGSTIGADPVHYFTGRIDCRVDYYDEYYYGGGYVQSCRDEIATHYQQSGTVGQAYLSAEAEILENLKAFGVASYHIFSMSDDYGRFARNDAGTWRLQLGLSYQY